MADIQEPDEVQVVKEPLDSVVAFNRFIHTRNVVPVFANKYMPSLVNQAQKAIQEHIKVLAETNPSAPVNLIKKAIESNSLRSLNESLFCLALCLELKNEELAKDVRQNIVQLVPKQEDLLYFCFVLKMLRKSNLSFSSAMKRHLTRWYDNQSPSALLDIVFATQKVETLTHKIILKLVHPKFENQDKNDIVKAIFMTYDEIKTAAQTSTTMKKILSYKDLKKCREAHEVASILKRKNFDYNLNHLPSHALSSPQVVELILPSLSIEVVLNSLIKLSNKQMLKISEPISKKICNALNCSSKTIKEANLNPLKVFEVMRQVEMGMSMFPNSEGPNQENTLFNPHIIKKLNTIFQLSMTSQPKTGCRYLVTVDLRKNSKRQSKVVGMEKILCSEAQIIVALTLLKSQKDVTIMAFTDEKFQLQTVPWTKDTTFEEAFETYKKKQTKTKESVRFSVIKATEEKRKIDVFITFVSSIARTFGTKNNPPLEELANYRKEVDLKMSKLIVVNLTRQMPDFKLSDENINKTGILEIVGFGPDSLKVIEAFSKNSFV